MGTSGNGNVIMNFKAILTSAFFFTVPEKKYSSLFHSDVLIAERCVYFKAIFANFSSKWTISKNAFNLLSWFCPPCLSLFFSQVPTSSVPHFLVAEVMLLFPFLLLPHPCSLKIAMLLFLFSWLLLLYIRCCFKTKKANELNLTSMTVMTTGKSHYRDTMATLLVAKNPNPQVWTGTGL